MATRSYQQFGVIFLTATVLLYWLGDFNLYIGAGSEKEFKAFPSVGERIVCSVIVGAIYAVCIMVAFHLCDMLLTTPNAFGQSGPSLSNVREFKRDSTEMTSGSFDTHAWGEGEKAINRGERRER